MVRAVATSIACSAMPAFLQPCCTRTAMSTSAYIILEPADEQLVELKLLMKREGLQLGSRPTVMPIDLA